MSALRLFKRKFLIRLMSMLGFGGMAVFCLPSCQQCSDADSQKNLKSTGKTDSYDDSLDDGGEDFYIGPASGKKDKQNDDDSDYLTERYGMRYPKPKPLTVCPNPTNVKDELSDLNRAIQSSCHPEPGKLVVGFILTPWGEVTNVKATGGSLKGSKFEACVLQALSAYRFSLKCETRSNAAVRYPFVFE